MSSVSRAVPHVSTGMNTVQDEKRKSIAVVSRAPRIGPGTKQSPSFLEETEESFNIIS